MKINFQNFHFEGDGEAKDYAADKIGHLEKYYKNIIMATISLQEVAGDTPNVRYVCKVTLDVPGENLYAEEHAQDYGPAIDLVEKKLKQQILKLKERTSNKKLYRAKEALRRLFGGGE